MLSTVIATKAKENERIKDYRIFSGQNSEFFPYTNAKLVRIFLVAVEPTLLGILVLFYDISHVSTQLKD